MPESPAPILTETVEWSETIHRIDPKTHLKGGIDGNLNKAARQLANRTQYLKGRVDSQAAAEKKISVGTDFPEGVTAPAVLFQFTEDGKFSDIVMRESDG